MDFSDINKISNMKRINTDAEKLREKVSREAKNIIKIKVAQDTAYWDLKEKLQQVEANYERLQQNMLEVQLQNEDISAKYQDELRRRPETLNKVSATREICGTLEEYIERYKGTIDRCRAGQVALAEAFERGHEDVQKMNQEFETACNQERLEKLSLQNKIERSEEREAKAIKEAQEVKVRCEFLDQKVYETTEKARRLTTAFAEAEANIDRLNKLLHEESQNASELRRKIEQHKSEYQAKIAELLNTNATLQVERSEAEQNAEEERALRHTTESRLITLEAMLNDSKLEHSALSERIQAVEKENFEKDTLLKNKDMENDNLVLQLQKLEATSAEKQAELNKTIEECQNKINDLIIANEEKNLKATETQKTLDEFRLSSEKHVKELETLLAEKATELDTKTNAIMRLMDDIKNESDSNARLETALRKARESVQACAQNEQALKTRVEKLEAALQEKIAAINEQHETNRKMAADKNQLQRKVQSLQNTIESVDKEIRAGGLREVPDRDSEVLYNDSEVHKVKSSTDKGKSSTDKGKSIADKVKPSTDTVRPSVDKIKSKIVADIYSFLSDTSEDYDPKSLDPADVQRRFEAIQRGETSTEPLRTRGELAMIARMNMRKEALQRRNRGIFKSKGIETKSKRVKCNNDPGQ